MRTTMIRLLFMLLNSHISVLSTGGNPLQAQLFPEAEPEQDQLFVRLQEVDGAVGGVLNDVVDEQL